MGFLTRDSRRVERKKFGQKKDTKKFSIFQKIVLFFIHFTLLFKQKKIPFTGI